MKTKTRVDAAGRIVIPKPLRDRYGLTTGSEVEITQLPDGIALIPARTTRRVVRRGRIVAIDTGAGVASADVFDVQRLRTTVLDGKAGTEP